MAGTTEILQEYLVKLGFQTDAVSFRKFENMLGGVGQKVFGVGSAVAAMTVAVEAGVSKFAEEMSHLYWQSQRTGSSVRNIRALGAAAEQIGISSGAIGGMVENFASLEYTTPGMQQMVNNLTGMNEAAKDTSTQFVDLLAAFNKMSVPIATQFAQKYLGMDPLTYRQIRDNFQQFTKEIAKFQNEMGDQQKTQRNAEILKNYSNDLNALEVNAKSLAFTVAGDLAPAFDKMAKSATTGLDFLNWLSQPGQISNLIKSTKGKSFGQIFANAVQHSIDSSSSGYDFGTDSSGGWGGTNLYQKLINSGWTRNQALGILANMQAESSFNPSAVGDHGQAYGLAQWHKDRQTQFKKLFGHSMQQSSADEQIAFMNWEMSKGQFSGAGRKLHSATTAAAAARIFSLYYERPAAGESAAAMRAALATRMAGTNYNITQNFTIHGSNATSVASAVSDKTNRLFADQARNSAAALR